jgi:hypothetical protein
MTKKTQEALWNAERIDSDWLNSVLSKPSLEIVSIESVGTGQVASALRIVAKEIDNPSAIVTYVAKTPSEDEKTRQGAIAGGIYLRELRFYEQLAERSLINVPEVFYSDYDKETGNFILLMEDMAPAEQGNQLQGCSVAQAELAMTEIAKLGGSSWQNQEAFDLDWMPGSLADYLNAEIAEGLWALFVGKHSAGFSNEEKAVATEFVSQFDNYLKRSVRRQCLVHCDYRIDNMLFASSKGGKAISTVDWQTLTVGSATFDAAYFIGTSLPTELRRQHEKALLERYHSELMHYGATNYSFDDCWQDYRGFSFSGFVMALVASATVECTERGDEMFFTMAKGSLELALDHSCLDVLSA